MKQLTVVFLFVLFWLGTGYPAISQITYSGELPSVNIELKHYELDLTIDYDAETLAGKAGLTLRNFTDQPVAVVPLVLYRTLSVESVLDENDDVLRFEQSVVSYEDIGKKQVNFIRIMLENDLLPGEELLLKIEYEGHLLGYSEVGQFYIKDHVSPSFTMIRNDGLSFPLPGVPSYIENRKAPFPGFTYRAVITVPDSLTVANGGNLIRKESNGDYTRYHYQSAVPSWRMDFAIAEYHILEADRTRIFHFPEDSMGAAGVLEAGKRSYNLFESWFGNPGNETFLTFIEIPDGWGSQKDAVTIIQTAAAFKDPARHNEVYHEISHFWNVKPLDTPSPRWDEGLASFLEYLAIEHIENREITESRANMLIRWLNETAQKRSRWTEVPMIDYGREQLTDLSYSVGALMFDLLYRYIGQDEFNAIIGGFFQEYNSRGATTEEFVYYTMEHTTQNLDDFFSDWVFTTHWYHLISENETVGDLMHHYKGK